MESERNMEELRRFDFPRKLSLEEVSRLFSFVGVNLPGEVEYGFDVGYRTGVRRITKEKIRNREIIGVGRFYGSVHDSKSMHGVPFIVGTEMDESRRVKCLGVGFQIIPGYSEQELEGTYGSNPDFIRRVRRVIEKYFQEVKGGGE